MAFKKIGLFPDALSCTIPSDSTLGTGIGIDAYMTLLWKYSSIQVAFSASGDCLGPGSPGGSWSASFTQTISRLDGVTTMSDANCAGAPDFNTTFVGSADTFLSLDIFGGPISNPAITSEADYLSAQYYPTISGGGTIGDLSACFVFITYGNGEPSAQPVSAAPMTITIFGDTLTGFAYDSAGNDTATIVASLTITGVTPMSDS